MIILLNTLVLIAGGMLAASSVIIAKKPNAKDLIDKLVPYQAMIGVAMLGLGIIHLLWWLGHHLFDMIARVPLYGLTMLAMCVTSILLGFMFGMPQLVKWMPGHRAAEQKGMALARQLAPFQVIIGLVGLLSALLVLLYRFGIL